MSQHSVKGIVDYCEKIAFDLTFTRAKAWKHAEADHEQRFLAAYLPIYFPREIIHALGGLPVGIFGTGDRMQIIKGDAYYQSYICHLPRGVIELVTCGALDEFDAFFFPSICDVIRNLSGMLQMLRPAAYTKYVDFPQNFQPSVGGVYHRRELEEIIDAINVRLGRTSDPEFSERLAYAIGLYNQNRRLLEDIQHVRQDHPWRLSAADWYHVVRAGVLMPVEEHNDLLIQLLDLLQTEQGQPLDNIRVVITGAFCEQPPVGLIRTIELAGCYIIDDDFMLGSRWIEGDIAVDTDDPLKSLVNAYLTQSTFSSSVYDGERPKGDRLIELVRRRNADGVVFSAPSFCDPALLDRPELQNALEREGIRTIGFQYSENTGQFKVIKEQVGAFSDSIKLWDTSELQVLQHEAVTSATAT